MPEGVGNGESPSDGAVLLLQLTPNKSTNPKINEKEIEVNVLVVVSSSI